MSRLLPSLPLRPKPLVSAAGPCRVCRSPPSTPPPWFPRSRSHSQAQRGPAPNGPTPNLRASVMEYTAVTRASSAATAAKAASGQVLVPVSDANQQEAVASSLSASSAMGKAAKKENKGVKSKHGIAKQQKKGAKKGGGGGGPDPPSSPTRQPPSRASGGVPDPSPAYLDQALGKPWDLARPRRLLVVLDLNGTMLHRPSKRRPFHFVERPHAQRFLAYCLDNFHLAIWSSARPANVARMVEKLLSPDQVRRCLLVWARDRFRLSPQDYDARVQVYKRLTRVWDDPAVRVSHPASAHGGRWDQSNTVLVDDSREKGRSEPYNILPLPEFSGLANETAEVLPQVHDYLNTLCWQADVSRYIRESPFQLDPNYRLSNQ